MSEYLDFSEDERQAYQQQALDTLSLYLESNNIAEPDEPACTSPVPFPHDSYLTIRQFAEAPDGPFATAIDDPRLTLEIAYGNQDSLSIEVYYLDGQGNLYEGTDMLDDLDSADLFRELEEVFAIAATDDLGDRRAALRRVIGPVIIANALNQIDALNARLSDRADFLRQIREAGYAPLMLEWLKPKKDFKTISEAVFGLAGILMADTGYAGPGNLISDLDPELSLIKTSEGKLFDQFTYPGSLERNLIDTTEAQAQITATILLPAFLAAQEDCTDSESLLERINGIDLPAVLSILENPDFVDSFNVLPLAPNGTFRNIIHFNGETLEIDQIHTDEEHFEPDQPKVDLLDRPFDVFSLYIKDENGRVVLNPEYSPAAKNALRIDSAYGLNDDGLTPTAGCPALVKHARLPDGVLEHHIEAMRRLDGIEIRTGENGAHIYFHRNVIQQLHKVHVNSLRRFLEFTGNKPMAS